MRFKRRVVGVIECSKKFHNTNMKTPLLVSVLSTLAGLELQVYQNVTPSQMFL